MKDIALHVLDIAQNSIRARASEISITVDESPAAGLLTFIISDNGKGMDKETCKKAVDPWYTSRTTRKLGMGLPLLKMNADLSGGGLTVDSSPGKGTTVIATFGYSHVDRPPLGDISGTIALLIFANPGINIIFHHRFNGKTWDISTGEISETLGKDALSELNIMKYLKEIINDNITGITN